MSEKLGTFPLEISAGEDDPYSKTMVLESDTPTASRSDEPLPEPDDRLQTGSLLRDRYLLQERIEGGSMGVVYKALDRHMTDSEGDEAAVAIKVLTPQLSQNSLALRALQQEAAKGRCLTHPNIVRFIDLDREDSLYFLIMEWLDGESLAETLDNGSAVLDLARSVDIVRQVGEALAYAHRRGVIHADVKPGNVMLLRDGSVKLIDFGIARVRQKQESRKIEESGLLNAATPAYSSMQVLTGEEPTVADDVFSLACLAYRLLAGHRVFGPRNAAQAAQDGMEPQRPPGISDRQWKALRKGLAYSRVTRQASPMELVDELLADVPASKLAAAGQSPVAPVSAAKPATAPTPPAPQAPAAKVAPVPAAAPKPAAAAPVDDVIRASRSLGPGYTHDESLALPSEDFVERRFDPAPRRFPYWLVLVVLLGALGALVLRPDWREIAMDTGNQWLIKAKTIAGIGDNQAVEANAPSQPDDVADVQSPAATATEPAAAPVVSPLAAEPVNESADSELVAPAATTAIEESAEAIDQPSANDIATPEIVDEPPAIVPAVTSAPAETVPVRQPVEQSPRAESPSDDLELTPLLVLAAPGQTSPELELSLTEGAGELVVELQRSFGLSESLLVRIDEVGFSGSRSPGEAGLYRLSDDGVVSFDPGQREASFSITVGADDIRETDRQVSLLLRDYYNPESALGQVELRVLDDDQRSFETNFRQNAVAFLTGRVIVRERDPAAQIDVVRYNPTSEALTVGYNVRDLSATEGEDYFVPARREIVFGPGQRNARLLIPLVQDSVPENDENFMIELATRGAGEDIIRRVAVIIRDDD